MIDRRAYALILTILWSAGSIRAQGEFPIGAWFPGLFNNEPGQWNARLQLVDEAHFNTIHAALEDRFTATTNQVWMDAAHRRGLNVQLYNWMLPEGWRGTRFWTQTFEAESARFTHATGEMTADGWRAQVGPHSAGLLLDTPRGDTGAGIWLRGNEDNRYTHHVFWLSTDDITGNGADVLARIRVIITYTVGTGASAINHTVTGERPVLRSDFNAPNVAQAFEVIYHLPLNGQNNRILVRYQVEWTDRGNLTVNRVRAHDADGHDLFSDDRHDMDIQAALRDYYRDAVSPPWRFYLYDEPLWQEVHESIAHVDEIIEEVTRTQTGTAQKGVSAFNQTFRAHIDDYMSIVQPTEFLVDYYAFGQGVSTRNALRSFKGWYDVAREVAQDADIPLWACVQAHDWPPLPPRTGPGPLRDPTGAEIRAQVNLALAHGATGVYYFMVSSHRNDDGTSDQSGLLSPTHQSTDKWVAVTAMNTKLEALAPTYLALTSNAVFPGTAPADFVQSLSDRSDYFLGTFTHTDGSRYLMIVNEQCTGTRDPTTVTLDASALKGDAYDYTLFDVYGDRRLQAGAGGSETHPEFSVTLEPGGGTLYRVEADLPVLASFGSSRYEMIEGGEAVSPVQRAENPTEVGRRVEVTVSLSAAPSERLEIPIEVTFGTKEYTAEYTADNPDLQDYRVSGLPSGGLTFTPTRTSASFRIRANRDLDVMDETIGLSFGRLPAGVRAGDPSTATVTIRDTPNPPEGLTATAGHGEVTLRWDAPDPENRGIRGWQYQVRLPPQQTVFGDWMPMGLGGFTDQTVFQRTEHTVEGLPNGVKHLFRVRAYTRGYGLASAPAAEATPNGLLAEPYRGAVVLRWIDDPEGEI